MYVDIKNDVDTSVNDWGARDRRIPRKEGRQIRPPPTKNTSVNRGVFSVYYILDMVKRYLVISESDAKNCSHMSIPCRELGVVIYFLLFISRLNAANDLNAHIFDVI